MQNTSIVQSKKTPLEVYWHQEIHKLSKNSALIYNKHSRILDTNSIPSHHLDQRVQTS